MKIEKQLSIFGEQCWGEEHAIGWQTLERDERPHTVESAIDYIEQYTGKLPEKTVLIPVQVLCLPGTNFFLMPVIEDDSDDDET